MAGITTAAAQLMHNRGIAATSLDDVLRASGAGKSQLYHYFGDKEELTQAVFRYQFGQVMAAQPSLTDEHCDDLSQWRSEVIASQLASGPGTCPLGAFVGQVGDSPALRETLAELFEEWRSAIAGLVHRAQLSGRVTDRTDPHDASVSLLAALEGGTILSHLRRDKDLLRTMLDAELRHLTPAD